MPGADLEVMCWSALTVAANLAIDDSLAMAAWNTGRRVLRFWWGGPPTVVIGFSERPGQVVDEAACKKLGVDILKRSTGGGSVLQTSGVLNYSLVTPALSTLNLQRAFRMGTDLVCAVLARFGLAGGAEGISDVAVGGRKISGNAQARRRKSLLLHGTLLADFDYDLAEAVLRHPPREPAYRRARSHRDFLVTLRELGVAADRGAIERAAVRAAMRPRAFEADWLNSPAACEGCQVNRGDWTVASPAGKEVECRRSKSTTRPSVAQPEWAIRGQNPL